MLYLSYPHASLQLLARLSSVGLSIPCTSLPLLTSLSSADPPIPCSSLLTPTSRRGSPSYPSLVSSRTSRSCVPSLPSAVSLFSFFPCPYPCLITPYLRSPPPFSPPCPLLFPSSRAPSLLSLPALLPAFLSPPQVASLAPANTSTGRSSSFPSADGLETAPSRPPAPSSSPVRAQIPLP